MTTQEQMADRALGRLEANVENLQTGVADLKSGLQQTNTRIDQTNSRIDQTNGKIDRLFYAIIGIGGGIIAALIALMLKGL
jgi:peptidoglycan hydrolase CwlO-like protein